ncbi:MAG: UPF0182 family protein [Candidatus Hadarchaeaceae archaeon]
MLRFLNQVPWNITDPVFGNDVSFYVFTLPFIETVLKLAATVSVLILISSALIYVASIIAVERTHFGTTVLKRKPDAMEPGRFLGSRFVLGSLVALTVIVAISVWLKRFSYLWGFSPGTPVPTHADYMAVNYLIPYAWVEALGVILIGALIISILLKLKGPRGAKSRADHTGVKREIYLTAIVLVFLFLVPSAAFGAINSLTVKPNEPGIQEPYLKWTIEFTLKAYNLDNVIRINHVPRSKELTLQEAMESSTVKNARIVDYRPILTSYQEMQRLRAYYTFHDVDVDRYFVENEKRLVVISGREMNYTDGWQNRHLFFTHGFGAVLSPANRVADDGTPTLIVKGIPPKVALADIKISQPRIYFGELTDDYAIINASGLDEFDYPLGETNVSYRYEHDRGIKPDSFWKRLFTFFYTGDLEIIVSEYIKEESRILLHRNVHLRVAKIAPFLRFDPDAQFFIGGDGGFYYLLSGITEASRFPYAYVDFESPGYLRDSVKVFVKADTGDVQLYAISGDDPVIKTYSKIYPGLFIDGEAMPRDFREHLIYPTSLFEIQMKIFSRYQMTDYKSFYQKEDLWMPAEEKYHSSVKRVEPYNILFDVSEIPGLYGATDEFTLIQPFTPFEKQNMRAWVGVAQDLGNYGKIFTLEFPKGELERGPMQVEAIIDQEAQISAQFTLWEGAGSKVLWGNLLVLPVAGDIIYIEPVYLSAEPLSYPQLRRVVAVYRNKAAMEETLEKAVAAVLQGELPAPPAENLPLENVYAALIQIVREHVALTDKYLNLMAEGKYAEAGAVMEKMVELEAELKKLLAMIPEER